MKLQKNDFVKINFTGKTTDGKVFDSTKKEELETINSNAQAKPFVFALGQGMFLKGIDDFLIGKDIGKYKVDLKPEDSFGPRDPNKIQRMPIKVFHDQKVQPVQGAMFNFDGQIAKVMSVSGGRVLVDFNNPMSGKDVTYEIEVIEKIEDLKQKVNALNEFLFRKELEFKLEEKKLTLIVDNQLAQFAPIFASKYKEVLGVDLTVETKK